LYSSHFFCIYAFNVAAMLRGAVRIIVTGILVCVDVQYNPIDLHRAVVELLIQIKIDVLHLEAADYAALNLMKRAARGEKRMEEYTENRV